MKLILFVLIVLSTKVLLSENVTVDRMERDLKTTNSPLKQSKRSVYSVSFERKKKDRGKPVKTYPTLDVTLLARNKISTRGYSSQQEYVETSFDSGPLNSINSTLEYHTNHSAYVTMAKPFPNSFKSMCENKSRLQRTAYHKPHSRIVGKIIKKSPLETPMTELDENRSKKTNIMKIPYILSDTTDEFSETVKGLDARILDDLSKKVFYSTPKKTYMKFQRYTSREAKAMKNSGTSTEEKYNNNINIDRMQNALTTDSWTVVNDTPQPASMMYDYGISQEFGSKLRRSRHPSDPVIAPDYEPVNNVFLNPDISQIIVDHPSKEINLKTLKKFKPLIPDYDGMFSRILPLKYIEETDEEFDWYQTDDFYDPTVDGKITTPEFREINTEVIESTSSTYEEDIPIREITGFDKQIMVLGVQHTPYIEDDIQAETNGYTNHYPTAQEQEMEFMTNDDEIIEEDENVSLPFTFSQNWVDIEETSSSSDLLILENPKKKYPNDEDPIWTVATSNPKNNSNEIPADRYILWRDLLFRPKTPPSTKTVSLTAKKIWINWINPYQTTENDISTRQEMLETTSSPSSKKYKTIRKFKFKQSTVKGSTEKNLDSDYFAEEDQGTTVFWPMWSLSINKDTEDSVTSPPFLIKDTQPIFSISSIKSESSTRPVISISTTVLPTGSRLSTSTTVLPTGSRLSTSTTALPTGSRLFTSTTALPTGSRLFTSTTALPTGSRLSTSTTALPTGSRLFTSTTALPTGSRLFTSTTALPTGPRLSTSTTALPTASRLSTSTTVLPTESKISSPTSVLTTLSKISTFATEWPTSSEKHYDDKLTNFRKNITTSGITTHTITDEENTIINEQSPKTSSIRVPLTSLDIKYSQRYENITKNTNAPEITPMIHLNDTTYTTQTVPTTITKNWIKWKKLKEIKEENILPRKSLLATEISSSQKYKLETSTKEKDDLKEMVSDIFDLKYHMGLDNIYDLQTDKSLFSSFENIEDEDIKTILGSNGSDPIDFWPRWSYKDYSYFESLPPFLNLATEPITSVTSAISEVSNGREISDLTVQSTTPLKEQISQKVEKKERKEGKTVQGRNKPYNEIVKFITTNAIKTSTKVENILTPLANIKNKVTKTEDSKSWPIWLSTMPSIKFQWPIWMEPQYKRKLVKDPMAKENNKDVTEQLDKEEDESTSPSSTMFESKDKTETKPLSSSVPTTTNKQIHSFETKTSTVSNDDLDITDEAVWPIWVIFNPKDYTESSITFLTSKITETISSSIKPKLSSKKYFITEKNPKWYSTLIDTTIHTTSEMYRISTETEVTTTKTVVTSTETVETSTETVRTSTETVETSTETVGNILENEGISIETKGRSQTSYEYNTGKEIAIAKTGTNSRKYFPTTVKDFLKTTESAPPAASKPAKTSRREWKRCTCKAKAKTTAITCPTQNNQPEDKKISTYDQYDYNLIVPKLPEDSAYEIDRQPEYENEANKYPILQEVPYDEEDDILEARMDEENKQDICARLLDSSERSIIPSASLFIFIGWLIVI
ncbi:unnamed protein product [Nezara viridula]|uniref:Neuropeptide n=1 Tax=Nezara viridula TaxID=85310 RepID=A0A9P0MU46_NEZVI|nr:unnamed protein product [Nezara viridula]